MDGPTAFYYQANFQRRDNDYGDREIVRIKKCNDRHCGDTLFYIFAKKIEKYSERSVFLVGCLKDTTDCEKNANL